MSTQINYGILGPGKIAQKFAHDLLLSKASHLYAVGSRSYEKANKFKEKFGVAKAYGSYDSLLEDPKVDVVYIATPHPFHYPMILSSLEHGKHVLCEKPICLNAKQLEVVIRKQKETNLFVMEALWTKFIPAYQELQSLIKRKEYQINSIQADFAFTAIKDPEGRLYNKNLAGGSLLDIGIYPVFLALDLLGVPEEITAKGLVSDGVDIRTSILMTFEGKRTAQLYSDIESETKMEALIRTSRGVFVLPERWHEMNEFYFKNKNSLKTFQYPHTGIGYYHEIEHVSNCLLNGKTQSPVFPLENSLRLIRHLDLIREQIGLQYPVGIEKV